MKLILAAMLAIGLAMVYEIGHAQAAPPSIVADVPNPAGIADCIATPAPCASVCIYKASPTATPVESAVIVDAVNGKPVNNNRICKQSAASATVGTNTVTFAVRNLWGDVSADSAPFTFARPGVPGAPVGTRLVP